MAKQEPTVEIILTLTTASADEARRLAELCPLYSDALTRFEKGVRQAQQEMIRKIRPEVSEKSAEG